MATAPGQDTLTTGPARLTIRSPARPPAAAFARPAVRGSVVAQREMEDANPGTPISRLARWRAGAARNGRHVANREIGVPRDWRFQGHCAPARHGRQGAENVAKDVAATPNNGTGQVKELQL